MKHFFLIFLILLFSCETKKQEINENLYAEIVKYQQYQSIPSHKEIKKNLPFIDPERIKYIYEVSFEKQGHDTLVFIRLEPNGIKTAYPYYGVYESKNLKQTYIIDPDRLSRNFIFTYKKVNIEKFKYKDLLTERAYPQYRYKVSNNKLTPF